MLKLDNALSAWGRALTQWPVWRRSLIIGLIVGAVQVAVNQGDFWLRWEVSAVVIVKTLITPMIAISVALFSAAGAYVEIKRQQVAERTESSVP